MCLNVRTYEQVDIVRVRVGDKEFLDKKCNLVPASVKSVESHHNGQFYHFLKYLWQTNWKALQFIM